MTGYARVESSDLRTSWVWEAKSVNGRGLDVRVRLPSGHDALEPYVRQMVAKRLNRGNISVSLSVSRLGEQAEVRVNTAVLAQLL